MTAGSRLNENLSVDEAAADRMDEQVKRWMNLMAQGLSDNARVISAILPRYSPEYIAVASSVDGLVQGLGVDSPPRVVLERHVGGALKKKVDVIVRMNADPSLERDYYFEFKPLWSRSKRGNVKGIEADLAALARAPTRGHAFVVVFAFCIDDVPEGCESFLSSGETLAETVGYASEHLKALPSYRSEELSLSTHRLGAKMQLLAWEAVPSPAT